MGYGFTCLYAKTRSRRHEVNEDDGCDGPSSNAIDELRDAINGYDDLAHRLSSKKKQDKFDPKELHNQVKDRVKKALDRVADTRAADIASPSDQDRASQLTSSQNQHRYLGEVSDVHFFNLVKGFLQTKDLSSPEQDFDSYEQDGEVWTTNNESNGPTLLPGFAQTRDLVKVYFSTIHIAYPFIPQSTFMESLAGQGGIPKNATDLAILCQSFYVLSGNLWKSSPHIFRCHLCHWIILYVVSWTRLGFTNSSRALLSPCHGLDCSNEPSSLYPPSFTTTRTMLLFTSCIQD